VRSLIIAIFIFIAAVMQLNILQSVNFFNIRPDILLILVIFFNMHFSLRKGLIIGGICGLLKDIFSSGIFGLNLFSFIICILVLKEIKKYFYKESNSMLIFTTFLISLINSIISCVAMSAILDLTFIRPFLLIIFLESIYTALISPIVFIPFKKCVLELSI